MGRLIDADVLMEYFKRLSDECSSENNYEYSNLYDCVCAKIMTQPTAYDVEKVVAELEEMRNKDSQGCKDVGNKCLSYTDCGLCIMDRAIDIVKRGGVDD